MTVMPNQPGPDDKDEHYVPSAPPTPITLRNAPPKAKRLRKGAVIAVSSVAALVAGAALYSALQPPKQREDDKKAQQTSAPITPDTINGLATNYSQVPADVPKLGQPRPGEFAQTQLDYERQHGMANGNGGQQDPYQQELDKLRAEELERAAKARTSSLFAKTDGGGTPQQPGGLDPMQQMLAAQRAGMQGGDGGLAVARSARDTDNRQDDKQAFLAQDRSAQLDTKVSLPQPLLSPYTIKAGTPIPGALVTGINSDLPGKIVGRVTEPVYDTVTGHYLLIPQGATIMADYDSVITYGQSRVQAVTVSVSLNDGSTVSLGKMAFVDQQGYAGLTGSVDNHWDRIGAVAGITGAFAFLTNWAAGGGSSYGYLSPKQAAAQAAADQLSQAGSQIMQKQLQIQPTITVAPGSRFNILLSQDVIVKPYRTGP